MGTSRSRGTDPMNSLVRTTVDALMPTPRASPMSMPASSMVRNSPERVPSKRSGIPAGRCACMACAMWSGHTCRWQSTIMAGHRWRSLTSFLASESRITSVEPS